MEAKKRLLVKITGIVQGVGFRPFVYTTATALSLNGWVNNISDGVIIEVEGSDAGLAAFMEKLETDTPPLAVIKDIEVNELPVSGYKSFEIKESNVTGREKVFISPDIAICEDCLRELKTSKDRRYLYPFINCTNCGPRFTIVKSLPYDRKNTTMKKFDMCPDCALEYTNPLDRRYHAQPISCHRCGPRLYLLDSKGKALPADNILAEARMMIRKGLILAVKGIGGFHLVCDALNPRAVAELRKRKIRDDKPFALMVKDLSTALRHCIIGKAEAALLESKEKPIVLLKKQAGCEVPEAVAPGNKFLGLMLPYTPMHVMLFDEDVKSGAADTLVMTSGNKSSEPIYYTDEDAIKNLSGIADFFVTHDRDIYIRTDDTVTRVFREHEYIVRRSRGYVPRPVTFNIPGAEQENDGSSVVPKVLACGGELKNTFCINRGDEFFVSHHIGDMENEQTYKSFKDGIVHFEGMFNIKHNAIAYDLHPDYMTTGYAMADKAAYKVAVQHHHAHVASCMAENNITGAVIGIALDGTGYGEDGNIWGGEFFTGDYMAFKRAAHLEYVKMPGGEAAAKEPWRMGLSYLLNSFNNEQSELRYTMPPQGGLAVNGKVLFSEIKAGPIQLCTQMIKKNVNSPLTSSMGRFFDAVSSIIGIRLFNRYEGQAAIELEQAAHGMAAEPYPLNLQPLEEKLIICTSGIIQGIIKDIANGIDAGIIAARFHETIADMVEQVCVSIRAASGLDRVVLSGGVFQNMLLLENCMKKLENRQFKVYIHSKIPCNDGGISLGQAAIAAVRFTAGGRR